MNLVPLLMLAAAQQSWTLTLGGDVMLNGIKSGSQPFAKVARLFQHADVTIVNLEIPLTKAKTVTLRKTKREVKARLQFILRADPAHAVYLKKCGIDAVSLGTNHAADFRFKGIAEMTAALDKARIGHSGAGLDRPSSMEPCIVKARDGTRVALISFATFVGKKALWHITPATADSAGVATLNHFGVIDPGARKEIAGIVAHARRNADVLVVALHGGIERTPVPTSYQVAVARAFVDAGADVVAGTHPHVLQGAERYRGHPIFYSLGNLVSPLPSTTALIHLKFQGAAPVRFAITPCRIKGGKTTPLTGANAKAGLKAFNRLCTMLARKYPNPHAVPLTAPLTVH